MDRSDDLNLTWKCRYAKQFDPERPCWFGDGSTIAAGMNLTALGCRNGADPTDEHCFMDVWVAGSAYVYRPHNLHSMCTATV